MWLLTTLSVSSDRETEFLVFFNISYLSSHMWLVVTVSDSTVL